MNSNYRVKNLSYSVTTSIDCLDHLLFFKRVNVLPIETSHSVTKCQETAKKLNFNHYESPFDFDSCFLSDIHR